MAGAKYKGEYEERVKGVLNEIEEKSKEGENIILFVDEAHQMVQGKEQSVSCFRFRGAYRNGRLIIESDGCYRLLALESF